MKRSTNRLIRERLAFDNNLREFTLKKHAERTESVKQQQSRIGDGIIIFYCNMSIIARICRSVHCDRETATKL
uniref:Uncharacterized protein n=1 Tax=Heterorhabditis bacteriophora TaxID=37862 RepID=A0A1I7XRJ1_HETBA